MNMKEKRCAGILLFQTEVFWMVPITPFSTETDMEDRSKVFAIDQLPDGFPVWFCDCLLYTADHKLGSPQYEWCLYEPGVWLEHFNAGLTPEEASIKEFCRAH